MGAVKRRREPAFDAPPPRRRARNAPHHPRPAAGSQRKVIKRKRESWFAGIKERINEFWESKRRWLSLTAIVLALFAAAGVYGFSRAVMRRASSMRQASRSPRVWAKPGFRSTT